MLKQISIILFGLVFFIAVTQSAVLPNVNENEFNAFLNRSIRTATNEQQAFRQQMLTAHNNYRKRHCTPALKLDDELNRSAQKYAEHLAKTNTFQHSGTKNVGENLYASFSSQRIDNINGATPTEYWYNEMKSYNFTNGGFSEQTGHFTQIVWKASQKLGAGFAFNNDHTKVYVVAQYSPPGNYLGQFNQNVLPANC